MLIIFIIAMSLSNRIGGGIEDILGPINHKRLGAFVFRCIVPGVLAYGYGVWYVGLSVLAGSALWFPFGWSFAEINGVSDDKYPGWLQWVAKKIIPNDSKVRLRAVIAKGIRGAFDLLTFVMLTAVNPYALVFWLGTFSMGAVYWACGRLFGTKAVPMAELSYGAIRGLLIGLAI